jgi:hypothetical protein
VSFSETTAGAHAFEGLVSAEVVTDMQAATNKVLKMVKGPGGQPWAGATVYTMSAADGDKTIRTVPNVGLNASKNVMVRAYSGAPIGTIITLKLENSISGKSVFAEAKTTKLNEWETLTFDFAKPSRDQVDANVTYNMASLFPAFSEIGGSQAALTANTTFYFDELKYALATITPPPPPPPPPASDCTSPACVDFSATGIGFGPFENPAGTVEIGVDPLDASNKVVKFVKKPADPDYFGTTITGLGVNPVLTDAAKTITMRVYSPAVGTNFLLKLEGGTGGTGKCLGNADFCHAQYRNLQDCCCLPQWSKQGRR